MNQVTWLLPQGAETFCHLLGILHGTEPVSGPTGVYFAALSLTLIFPT